MIDGSTENLVKRFFQLADSLNCDAFCEQLSPDVAWRFGNFPPAVGVEAVRAQYDAVTQILRSMRHEIVGIWRSGDCITTEIKVFYEDRHGRTFEFPACDLIFVKGNKIGEVRIFVDNHLLFEPPK